MISVVETIGDGKVFAGKAAVLADAKTVKWTSGEYKDLKVTVFRDTAIATGNFNGKGTDSAGKPVDEKVRFTGQDVDGATIGGIVRGLTASGNGK